MTATFWFHSKLGPCGISYSPEGLTAVALPEPDEREARDLRARIAASGRQGVPPFVREAARLLERHLAGKPQDLSSIRLDLAAHPAFRRRVWEAARAVPPGRTATYGDIARLLGRGKAARAVGQALARNPLLLVVPCHRVLGADGRAGGFSAPGGLAQKERLLALEGVALVRAGAAGEEERERLADRFLEASAEAKALPGMPSLFRSDGPGFSFDAPRVVRSLARKDPHLAPALRRVGPFRMRHSSMHSPFEALASSIVYQQLTGKAAATILSRLVALFAPRKFPRPEDLLAVADERLRSAGLSRGKVAALQDLARKTLEGIVPPLEELSAMEEEAIVERLTAVRGIGRWTVEMLLMFRLGRPDVLPATDYGVRKGFARALGKRVLPSPAQLLAYGERWRPFRTVASWYLWRVAEMTAAELRSLDIARRARKRQRNDGAANPP